MTENYTTKNGKVYEHTCRALTEDELRWKVDSEDDMSNGRDTCPACLNKEIDRLKKSYRELRNDSVDKYQVDRVTKDMEEKLNSPGGPLSIKRTRLANWILTLRG